MSILDVTVVNVALPTFQTELSGGGEPLAYSTVAWTATAYMLALAAVIPLTGWAADRFGTKRLYLTAIALFTIGSLLCATAWNIEALIGFRVLQGLGGGMLMPLGMTIMTKAAGPHRMGRLMAILGIPMLLGPIMGPILGGVLIDAASWHWVFLINLPIGIIGLIYAFNVLPKDTPEPSESLDWVGMLMLSPGLASLLYGVSSIPGEGTVAATKVLVPMIIGLALIGAFVFWSFKPKHPLLDLRLFANRNLTISIITMFLFASAFFGALLLVPTYFQQVDGDSVKQAGSAHRTPGHRRHADHADRRCAHRQDPGRPHRAVRLPRHPDRSVRPVAEHRSRYVQRADHGVAVRHGSGHGLDDDAAVHLGAQDTQGSRRGPRLDAAQRDAAGGQCNRHRGDLGRADQRHEEPRRARRIREAPGRRRWSHGCSARGQLAHRQGQQARRRAQRVGGGTREGLPGSGGRVPDVVLGRLRRPGVHADPGVLPAAQA